VADPLAFAAEQIRQLAGGWDALADTSGAGPFVRAGWFEAWLNTYAPEAHIRMLTLRRDEGLVGVLPLIQRRTGVVSPTNWHTPAYGAVAADDDAARQLARAALEGAGPRLDLAFLDPDEPFTRALLEEATAAGRLVITRPVLRSPWLRLDGDFEAYEKTRPSKFRREIGRRRKKLAADHGEVEVTFTDGREGLERLLDEGFAVEGSGWKTARGTAIAQDAGTERFYRDVAAWAAASGWLQLGFVRVAGKAVAFSYSIVLGDTCHVVKVGFDPEFARYAVGTLLTRESIARAYERGLAVYDFLGSEDRYKLDWTDTVRERLRVQAFARSPAGAAGYVAWRHGRPAAKRVNAWGRERLERRRG
jgi:CelD/BcsL family acetyltransferase involved in cellulose biosynthesis